jgi:hypothetical protein
LSQAVPKERLALIDDDGDERIAPVREKAPILSTFFTFVPSLSWRLIVTHTRNTHAVFVAG